MRITDNMRMASAVANQQRVSKDLYEASRRASSGQRVEKPSDDPVAFASIASKDAALSRLASRRDAISKTSGDVDLAESSLASAGEVMNRVREITLQMANGDVDATVRATAAKEIDGLRGTLLGLANTKGSRGYLFAGTKTDAPPFSAAGAFTGNDESIDLEVADGVRVATNASGAKAFTVAGGRDVFQDLADLGTALATNDVAGIKGSLDKVDLGQRQLIGARSDTGLTAERLRSADDVSSAAAIRVKAARAGEAEVDAVKAFTDLTSLTQAYERSIEVTKRLLSLPTFDPS